MTNTTLDGSTVPFLIPPGTTQQANNGDELLVLGTIENLGEIFLNGTGGPFTAFPTALSQFALLVLSSPTVTLTGGGTVLLSGTDPAEIVSTNPANTTLRNASGTIAGSGDLGPPGVAAIDANDTLYPITLINQAGGVIDATGTVAASGTSQASFIPAQALYIHNGSSVLVNAGLMEATGIGGLFISSATIDQSGGGTILATGTGVSVSVSATDLIGGTLDAVNGGSIRFAPFSNLTLDGSGSPLTIGTGSNIEIALIDASIGLLGTIINHGTFGGGSTLILDTPTVTMSGGGDLLNPMVVGHGGSLAAFVNGDTISGTGVIGESNNAPIALTNLAGAVIDATGTLNSGLYDIGRGGIAGILLYNGGTTSINDGLLEATGIQGLDINGGILDQSGGGTLLASGAGVGVYLQSVDLIGGQIVSNNGGLIAFNAGASTLDSAGAPLAINAGGVLEVISSGVANVSAGTLSVIGSAIANAGTIIDNSTLILTSPTVTLTGGGVVQVAGVLNTAGTGVLINNDNTVTGTGDISSAALTVTNAALGVINGISLDVGGITSNAGLLENVSVGFNQATTIDNTGTGELLAAGAGAVVGLYDADIVGGTLASSGGGTFQLGSVDQATGHIVTLDGRGTPVTIAAGTTLLDFYNTQDASLTFTNDSGLALLGTIDLLGTIQGNLEIHSGPFAIPNAGVLTGSGTVNGYLTNTGTVLAQSGTLTVTNNVDGSGSIAINPGAAFVLGGESGETVNFGGGTNEQLVLNTPAAFTGTLANLAVGDRIDLGTDNIQSAIVTGNTLQVTMTNASTLDYTLSAIAAGATIVPVTPSSLPEVFNFTYTGAAGAAYPGVSAQGSGSFTVLSASGPVLSLANVVSFNLTLTVTKTGAGAGTDVITYTLPDLKSFAASLGGGTLTSLSLGTDDGGYNHSVPVVDYETFQISNLGNGGAATDFANSNKIVTQGSVAVTPGGPLLSELLVQCFAEGTLIATPDGERAVETLTAGETVLLASGDTQDIVWIGRRRIDVRHHPDPMSVRPVRIAAGAFGPGRPRDDLFLSPDHAVFVNGVLIPIRHLINLTTIAPMPVDEVVYYHIELPSHDLLLAEGLAVESWLDTGDRSHFDNGERAAAPHRDLSGHMWEAMGCAPLIVAGPHLDAARRIVEERCDDAL